MINKNDCTPEACQTSGFFCRVLSVCFSIFIAFMLVGVPQVQAGDPGDPTDNWGIQPTFEVGNPSCIDFFGGVTDIVEFRINSDFGNATGDGVLGVDITLTGNNTFRWDNLTGAILHGIFVKGGPNGNLYTYDGVTPPADPSFDTSLHSPINPNNGRFYGLSHISFCYVPGEPSIDVQKTCDEQTVNDQVVTTVNEVTLDNDGDFELTNIMIREDYNAGLSCALTKVDGANVNVALPLNTWVTVPNGGGFDGNLVVGEEVELEVTCHDGSLNLANKISGKGDWTQGTVMDMDTSNPAAECPFSPDPMVSIDKDCPAETDVRMMAMNGMLVAQVCPEIIVTNESSTEPLSSVIVSDPLIPALSSGVQVGPLAPLESVALGADEGIDLCYLPSAPEVAAFDDNGTPSDPSDDKYLPSQSGFLNLASVFAVGQFGGNDSDSDDTALRDAMGNILYLLDEMGQQVTDTDGNPIPLSECPLCAPCPDCPN